MQPALLETAGFNVVETGSGHALLFLHGNGRTWEDWRGELEHYAGSYRCVAFDQRGYGASTAPAQIMSIAQMADDAAAVCHRLGIEHAYVIGCSMGAQVAMVMALRYPQMVDGVVLNGMPHVEKAPDFDQAGPDVKSMSDEQLRELAQKTYGTKNELSPEMLDYMVSAIRAAQDAPPQPQRPPVRSEWSDQVMLNYAGVSVPALVLVGTDDQLAGPPHGRALAELMPKATYAEIAGANHISNLNDPEAYWAHVDAFIAANPCERS